eukprot:TRINITY_DN11995_c0_g2_i1.p1 TRINITY_DN11995_c0_g2~~TRINITY_DN11995_c0_g2_i1.p1  ORF type:complete len:104 (+),score=11.36 TRINITY_DN11995_c0_g2_i1:393-704(+)
MPVQKLRLRVWGDPHCPSPITSLIMVPCRNLSVVAASSNSDLSTSSPSTPTSTIPEHCTTSPHPIALFAVLDAPDAQRSPCQHPVHHTIKRCLLYTSPSPRDS